MEIDDLIDALVLAALKKEKFSKLDEEQQAMAALQLMVVTNSRSGLDAFLTEEKNFLFESLVKGFRLLDVSEYIVVLEGIMAEADVRVREEKIRKMQLMVGRDNACQFEEKLNEYMVRNQECLGRNLDVK